MSSDSNINSNAQTGGTGKGGSITFTGAGSVPTTIAGGTIQAQSETSAIAGDITLYAPGDLTLLGTTVSVKNTGPGSAGSINLRAGNDLLVRNSQVSTESANASGGNITLTTPNLVRIVDSTLTSSVQGQAGSNGGNINIDPQWVVIQNSQLLANANAGAGGNITIAATGAVLVDPNSRIDASAGPAGVSGSVNINAPIQVLSGALVPLKLAYSQPGLSGERCAADPTGQFSSFVQAGRDGVPQVPGALSPSPLSFLDTLTSGSLGSQSPNLAAARLGLDSVSFDHSTRFHSACRS
jgi:large exoprotein involved in heme utilization and adhesion